MPHQGESQGYSELNDLVLDNDTGARRPSGVSLKITLSIALLWSIFQLWISSPIPFILAETSDFFKILVLNSTKSRYVHLVFAFLLVFLSYPATKKSPRNFIPISDWVLAILASGSALYLLVFYNSLAARSGMSTNYDVIISTIGIITLLEATRRALGPPLMIIASIFLIYTYAGPYMPDVLAHKGHNITKITSHQWLATEGIFGIALGVSTSFVFLFVLFGSLLDKAGAGNYFIKLAFSLLGHLKGGPAKAAVLSSGMTGLISGSSIANVVTTGTFTVPLMRKVGFSREKSGSVEVASSVNGQIMPPVMGAAAFLMVEYIGIPYIQVIKHALIPAVISYIALLYIVHLEAVKFNMKTLPKKHMSSLPASLIRSGIIISSILILSAICYYLFSFTKGFFGGNGIFINAALIFCAYLFLLKIKSNYPDLDDDPNHEMVELPDASSTVTTGLHYILPIATLIWCLMVERLSPGLSAFWAVLLMMIIILTQKPIVGYFRKQSLLISKLKEGWNDLIDGLITGAKNMAGIGVATAAAGIVVGAVTQTGVGGKMTELVEIISGGSIILMLLFTALICIIMGMGLPTTANYIVVSSLMASVVVELGKQNGFIIPLVAVHFFVFYFGIMADVTPPVGLASFAAAAVSGGDPIKTSLQAFKYSMRTMILPFLFVFDTEMLLIGVTSFSHAVFVFVKSTIAILVFTAATQGYFVIRNKMNETIILFIISFSIFLPSFWINKIVPPYITLEPQKIYSILDDNNASNNLKMDIVGEDIFGDKKRFTVETEFKDLPSAQAKLKDYGIILRESNNKMLVSSTIFGSKAKKEGFDIGFEITNIYQKQKQPSKLTVYFPALLLLLFVFYRQKNRKRA